ncbi:MAG: glutathione S-transferase family protein [bacterium]
MITLYGVPRSRTLRCLWMLEEVGVPYQLEKVVSSDGGKNSPEYTAINPNQKIPALRDGDLVLWESLAINQYLAEKYGGALWPETPEARGLAYQWGLWALGELDPYLSTALYHRLLASEENRDEEMAAQAEATLQKPLGVLNAALESHAFLLGGVFTIADLNVASVVSWAPWARLNLTPFPAAAAWLNGCLERPASKKALAML